uniref:Pathogenesis enhancement protein n=1 Tax=Beet curly top virus TaxID=10840 RepID=A0A0N9E473_9GEMI|nr:pathogenesis enhancement protein [Beet curly top virus]
MTPLGPGHYKIHSPPNSQVLS